MNNARQQILDRLRHTAAAPTDELSRPVECFDWSLEEKLSRFTERMEAVRAEVHRSNRRDWPGLLKQLALAKDVGNILFAQGSKSGAALANELSDSGIEPLAYLDEIEGWKDRMFEQVEAAFTGSRGAIAETGSLILWPDADEPRLMTLVPPIHFVLLDAEQLYSSFAEAMQAQHWAQGMPTNALLISGPSKSADIAQVLAYGVHGPKELVVLIIE